MDNKVFKEEQEAPIVANDEIRIRPWVETNRERGTWSAGLSFGLSLEKLGQLLGKLKFWKKK